MKAPRTTPSARLLFAALPLLAGLLLHAPPSAHAQARPAPTPKPTRPAAGPPPKVGISAPIPAATPKPRPTPAPLAGRVVGDGGEPLAGVPVYAGSRGPSSGVPRPSNTVTSDDAGNFLFPSLEPGLYLVSAGVPGYIAEVDQQTGRVNNTYRPGDNVVVRMVKGGVITGSVIDQQGEPLVALSVRALRVRDLEGRTPPSFPFSTEDRTDDRGVYRIYGLQPGVYIVFAGGGSTSPFGPSTAYGGDVSTFYPSGTRDTAAEVTVRGGQETAGIDIRYREEQGHRVTGTVEFPASMPPDSGVGITLAYAGTAMPAGNAGVASSSTDRAFSIEGIADGDYELQAQGGGRDGLSITSAPQRVSVRGGDVTGVRVTLVPLASASGTLRIEPAAEALRSTEPCKEIRSARLPQETLIMATPERPRGSAPRPFSRADAPREIAPEETGDFTLRALEPSRYRLSFRVFDESLYVRSVQPPGTAPNAPPSASVARDMFEVKTGQQLKGIDVRLAEGAATFGGRVAVAEGAAPQMPAPTRAYLVPQERERAEDPLRYYEATVASADGAFSFKNVAPGRYLLLARAEADTLDTPRRPPAWDADTRARLRREAEAAATPVELQPCRRTSDFTLKYPQTK